MRNLIHDFLEALGMKFLTVALKVLPEDCPQREGVFRGLREQRLYDNYENYTLLLNERPLSFDRWREQYGWLHMKCGAMQ